MEIMKIIHFGGKKSNTGGDGGGIGGTINYNDLINKPSINKVALAGDKTAEDLKLASQDDITNLNNKKADKINVYTKTEIDDLIGDIPTVLDTINGE